MATRQYIGARYVIKVYENSQTAGSAEWETDTSYEPLTMVTFQNSSYLSKKAVPSTVGNPSENPTYWVITGAYNGQIASLQSAINELSDLVNKTKLTTPEEYGAKGDGVTDDTEAIQSAFNNGDIIVLNNSYRISDTLFLTGNKTVTGNGKLLLYLPETTPATDVYGIILGANNFSDTGETFTGSINGIDFVLYTGRYNYVIGGVNACDCEIANCTFDLSRVDCHNKVIFFGPNGTIATDNSNDEHYLVFNNRFVFDNNYNGTTNQCEPIGFQTKNDISVMNNVSEKGKDDFGFHNCARVTCSNNKLVDNYKTRFLFTNSRDIVCNNNVIQQNKNLYTQGIYVGWESGFTDGHFPENFEICGNVIDFRGNEYANYTYGIRVQGSRHGVIANNKLLTDNIYHGRIIIENNEAFESLLTVAHSEDIDIHDNTCGTIGHILGAGLASDPIEPFKIHDNVIKFNLSLNTHFDFSEHNTITANDGTMTKAKNYQSTRYNTSCVIDGTAMDGTEQPMLIDGFPELIVEKRARLLSAYFACSSPEVSLSGGNYITYEVKKNGTTVATIDSQHNTYGTLSATDFDAKDVLTVTARYYGTAPSPKPSYVGLKFNLEYFEDC